MSSRGVILACLAAAALILSAQGAVPRDQAWESAYAARLQWWSLQPLTNSPLPQIRQAAWPRTFVDTYILARLEKEGLTPAPEADPATLARRLSFALTGLPPTPDAVMDTLRDPAPQALESLARSLLASPQFGEHWARHWMDVVHYSDTHGYEWDAPAKNAWRYRDYLIRAFNADLPINRLILEQLAGDLIEPRPDASGTFNESLIGPMALRLGERRHGDNAAAEGVTQEAIANIIDTVGKGFLGTTVACAQCHDHKLDAVGQRDYYSLSGVFMSTRWNVRSLDLVDPNLETIRELGRVKEQIRLTLAALWASSRSRLTEELGRARSTNAPSKAFPESLRDWWLRCTTLPPTRDEFLAESQNRVRANQQNLQLVADFSSDETAGGWRWEGLGMKQGLVRDGELVIREEGTQAVRHLLPAGRWSHVWSPRLAGALRSPLFEPGSISTLSMEIAAGAFAAQAMIVDHAFHSERMQFIDLPFPSWKTWNAGQFDTLEGGIDKVPRRSYLELATKSLNNYFPPRTGYGGVKDSDALDERSWLGASRVFRHPAGKGPVDELGRFAPLFHGDSSADWTNRFADLILMAVERWRTSACSADDVRLLNEALQLRWLPNDLGPGTPLAQQVEEYRRIEKSIQPDRTVGSAADWEEAQDERIGIRGSYTELGDSVPRGQVRFLSPTQLSCSRSSGRLELARNIAHPTNPLTARVFVNRVWHYLFGAGLVRTPDDFGHLGEPPTHPELLDALAARFVQEGWSLKRLVTVLITSATWRQSGQATERAVNADPENRLWHHLPAQRLEAESIRDALLASSGRLDPRLYGPPIDPYRTAQDAAKRLFTGPLGGEGRRSLYIKMTLMEPPRFLALFNQPIPKLTTGRRDVTQVPDQALALLNDPFVQAMAREWSLRVLQDGQHEASERARQMFLRAVGRLPGSDEVARLIRFAQRSASLHGDSGKSLLDSQPVWQDVAHALFNLDEFIHVY